MKSTLPKVMHKIAGRTMLGWLIERAESLNPHKIIVVTAPGMDDVRAITEPHEVAIQENQNGTGDAVKSSLPLLEGFDGRVLVLMGDEPFVDTNVLTDMVENDGVSVMAVELPDITGLGRVISDDDGYLLRIVEEKDCTDAERRICIGNAGNMCLPADKIHDWAAQLSHDNAQGEYYLTDIPQIAAKDNIKTKIFETQSDIGWGINNRLQLAQHEAYAQDMLRMQAMENGVTMVDPNTVTLSWDTEFGEDVMIEPNVYLGPWTAIESNVTIHAFSYIEGAVIEGGAEVGPYARIRPKSVIEAGASVGNFIEVNRSTIKAGAKAKHVSYLGDTVVGENSNIGAGTIIANYDGFFKNKTIIGKNVFVGSNSTIIAPVEIGEGAIIAAGSNINKDIDTNALAVARSRQENHAGWATQYRYVKREQKQQEQDD